jgi:hypothetical protein
MGYEKIKGNEEEEFRRLTGIKKTTYAKMVEILKEAEREKKSRGGKSNVLSMEDRLLMTLEYMREYRTYFHIGTSYGVSESACYRNIIWIEGVLVKHPDFRLPGRKALQKSDIEYEVVLIDATETPIERPKKTKAMVFWEEKETYHKESSDSR